MCVSYCSYICQCCHISLVMPQESEIWGHKVFVKQRFEVYFLLFSLALTTYITMVLCVWLSCVLCPSANKFLAILILLLARSSSNSPRSWEGFRQTLVQNFIQIQQQENNFPIDPHCKNYVLYVA